MSGFWNLNLDYKDQFSNRNLNNYWDVKIIESDLCMGTWQLNDFAKELMGPEWVKKFDAWAEHALPKQPTAYLLGNTLVVHPSLVQEFRKINT